MVEQDKLRARRDRGVRADDDIPRVRVAVDPPPLEDLRAEQLDHRVHYARRPAHERLAREGETARLCVRNRCRAVLAGATRVLLAHELEDPRAVAQAHAVDPFGDEDLFGRELRVGLGDVYLVGETGLLGDEIGGLFGVLHLEVEVQLAPQMVRDEVCSTRSMAQNDTT